MTNIKKDKQYNDQYKEGEAIQWPLIKKNKQYND
jgi:hypothetical protein